MTTTKVFISGNSQAVRIPKKFHLTSEKVEIFKRGDDIIIREKPKNLSKAFKLITQLAKDFFAKNRKDEPPQGRDFF